MEALEDFLTELLQFKKKWCSKTFSIEVLTENLQYKCGIEDVKSSL